MPPADTPVVFVHGLWLHADSWSPCVDLFREAGYGPQAPGWPGDAPTVAETRANPDALDDVDIEMLVDHYARLIGTPEVKPIVIGHSFGGLIAQELLANNVAAAAVGIDEPEYAVAFGKAEEAASREAAIVNDSAPFRSLQPRTPATGLRMIIHRMLPPGLLDLPQ